jgi:hypothetical protein
VNVVQQAQVQSIPSLYSSALSVEKMTAVAMHNIPSLHPSVGSNLSEPNVHVQNIPDFVQQVQQRNLLMPGLPLSAPSDTPLSNIVNTNVITTPVSQCASIASVLSSSTALSDNVVKSVNAIETQSSGFQKPAPSSAIADPPCHTSSHSTADSTPQPQGYQQNYQLLHLAQQQSMMENSHQPNLTDNISILSHSASPQTSSLGVSTTTQYHSQPSIPHHDPQKATASDSSALMSGSQVTSSDVSNVSFQQALPQNSNYNQVLHHSGIASKLIANSDVNTSTVQSVTLKVPYASCQQIATAQMPTYRCSKVDALPLQQTAPVILLQQPSPTTHVVTGDSPCISENYMQDSSSMLQYLLQHHMKPDYRSASSNNNCNILSSVLTPFHTPNPASASIPGALNTHPLQIPQPQTLIEKVQSVSKTSPVLQDAEETSKIPDFHAKHCQCQGTLYSTKVDQTLNYQTPKTCVNVRGSQICYPSVTEIGPLKDQLLNIQINEPPQYNQKFDVQKEQQQIKYSPSAESKTVHKVSEVHHLVQQTIYRAGEMLEASLNSGNQNMSTEIDKQICVNCEVSSVTFSPKQMSSKEETQRACICFKKDQEEVGTQMTMVDSPATRDINLIHSINYSLLGATEEAIQTSEIEEMMPNLPVPDSLSNEMATQSHFQGCRRTSGMSIVQGSPTKSTTKVEDGFFK